MRFARRDGAPLLLGVALALLSGVGVLSRPAPAGASANQRAILQDDVRMLQAPAATLHTLRQLGVGTLRFTVHWSAVAPNPRPPGFNASDPAAYPPSAWASYDTIVKEARAAGIELDLVIAGGAPRWATSHGVPASQNYGQWRPSAREFGHFLQAVAMRYSGSYVPPGSLAPLPGIHLWEIWNEENWGQDLAPQASSGSSAITSPSLYRPLLDAGWSALQRTPGHQHDAVVLGSLSPRGHAQPGSILASKPLLFLRDLYCVDSTYKQLRGAAAARIGCPTSKAGSRAFRSAHPALFKVSGIGIHPYPLNLPPTRSDSSDPDDVEFNGMSRLSAIENRLQRAYGSHARPPIYNTEYGYETNPPNHSHGFVSPQTAAYYINWAEYLSWRNRRVASYTQFLLYDPNGSQGAQFFGEGGFAAGLIFASHNRPKADYYAYRLPIYLPQTTSRHHRKLEVWGCVRPAHFAQADTGLPQYVRVQLNGRTVTTVRIRNPRGYFDVRVAFPKSGSVRLAWSYPASDSGLANGKDYTDPLRPGQTVYSRSIGIAIR